MWLSCLGLLVSASVAEAAVFATADRTTLRMEAVGAEFIVVGTLQNAREGPGEGSTDFVVTRILKCAPVLLDEKVLTIPGHLPTDPQKPTPYLVFGEVFKGKPDLYRGLSATPALIEYVRGLLAIDVKDHVALMRYCFGYLDHAEQEISEDALQEFLRASDADIRKAARGLPAERLRRSLEDKSTPAARLRLYGYLLGNCGAPEDAALLRRVLDRLLMMNPAPPVIDGIFTGYILLAPKEGEAYLFWLLANPETHFMVRYSGLRTLRYFRTTQPGVLAEQRILDAVGLLLEQADIADLPIEDLRHWRCWKLTDKVLRQFEQEAGKVAIVKRAIVRYALQCPDSEAACFVMRLRKTDPALVEAAEEALRAEGN
jgi:hypothetical protein